MSMAAVAAAESESEFGRLPVEAKRKVFSFLSPLPHCVNARQVCTSWCDLVDEERLVFNVELSNETLSTVQSMNRPIKNLLVSGLSRQISFEESIRGFLGTKVEHLVLGQASCNGKGLSTPVTQDSVVAILTALKEITSLTVFPRALRMKDLAVFQMISLSALTNLHIQVRRLSEIQVFIGLLKLTLPSLTSLAFDWDRVYINSAEGMIPLYVEIYQFVARQAERLKKLQLVMPFHWIVSRLSSPSSLDVLDEVEKAEQGRMLKRRLEKVQLNEVILKGLPVEGSPVFNLGFHLLNAQKGLKKLSLNDVKVCYYTQLQPLLFKGTLTDLAIDGGASMGANSYGPLSCSLFKGCSSLRALIIHNAQITELTHIEDLPASLQILSLKMPINGERVYGWIADNLCQLRELTLRPTLWDSSAVVDMSQFRRFLALPYLTKLTLSDGLFQSKEIIEFTRKTQGLWLHAASYCWPDLVSVHIDIDREVFKDAELVI